MSYVTEGDYPEIRAVLHAALDPMVLPNHVIELPTALGAAEDEVAARVTGDLTDEQTEHARRAVVFLTAARLAHSTNGLLAIKYGANNATPPRVNEVALREQLRAWAESELGAITDEVAELAVTSQPPSGAVRNVVNF